MELGRLNVFIGANGSGKSNILEGIAFASAVAEGKGDNEFLFSRGIRTVSEKLMKSGFDKSNKDIFIEFSDDALKTKLRISYNSKKWINENTLYNNDVDEKLNNAISEMVIKEVNPDVAETFSLLKQALFQKETFDPLNLNPDQLRHIDVLTKLFTSMNDGIKTRITFFDFLIFAPENTFLRRFEEEGQIKPLGIRGEGLFKEIVEISEKKDGRIVKINEFLQLLDWFDSFEIPNDLMFTEQRIKIKDRYLEDGLQFISQGSANEGFLYLLFYLTLFISDDTPKFFAIDNIDNAMNPKLGSELIRILSKLAKEHDKQVILTTHNPSVLDGLDLQDDEQRLFVISRNKLGHTQAIRVPHRESDERLSTRFIRGSIGGLPKNF